ncbi:ester cyclase [Sulfitobacter sabulilitoris]|uniref:Ester cyclase n=1 Tax=Sulfitobacter sabulilitoris TaxID=2562655 RepID=A0A5S3PF47_9RHOB|nr:ester cyclase [Sulfitobacter sabulilitoris]TMM51740.1 ester cyclase [Sulfitobacter sabulilitoris]
MLDNAQPPTALGLLRRWVVDYFNRHDAAACADFIVPDYSLHIGDTVFRGRDTEWLPAVDVQMKLFPGLAMTVHQTLSGPDWAAAYFSEHGASKGRAAVWSGIAIYRTDGTRLVSCVAQEDYMTRQRQLKSGLADPAEPPAVAPWDGAEGTPDPDAEAVVRDWLGADWPLDHPAIRVDDEHITGTPLRFATRSVDVRSLHSADGHVVFHAVYHGQYQGGLPKVDPTGQAAHLHCNGMLRVEDGKVSSGRIIRDRLALRVLLRERGGQ